MAEFRDTDPVADTSQDEPVTEPDPVPDAEVAAATDAGALFCGKLRLPPVPTHVPRNCASTC